MSDETRSGKNKDRVLLDQSVLDIYQQLRRGANSAIEQAPFETNKDIFMFAVSLGFQANKRRNLPTGPKSDIRSSIFSTKDMDILRAIALAETGTVDVLGNLGEVLTIAEEYAHGGIYDVKSGLLDERGQPLWNLVDILLSTQTSWVKEEKRTL